MARNPVKSIPEFYAGQSIFLTGATGFVGKVFIEKVLRCCPDVSEIFLLIRPKKNSSIEDRLKNILNLPLFDKLREERPLSLKKLIPILGDAKEEKLGLSTIDRQMLTEKVSIIIHAAASVRFNESLTNSIFINLRSTRDICILAQNMKNLIALVYVGTAYAHIENAVIEEKIYPSVTDWQKIIKTAERLNKDTLKICTTKYIGNSLNTYVFTKKLAENIIEDYSTSLPCAIIRPSMITNSANDPFPGWLDNTYGPIGLFIAGAKGVLRVIYHNTHISFDMTYIDFVVKTIVAAPWKLGLTNKKSFTSCSSPFVVNCTSERNMSMYALYQLGSNTLNEVPLENIVWTSNIIFTESNIVFFILTILCHFLPAMLVDLILKLSGSESKFVKMARNLYVVNCVLKHFMTNEWKFKNANNSALMSLIPLDDRNMFSYDWNNLDKKDFLKNCTIGTKKFVLYEDMNRLDAAKAHYKRVYLWVPILKTFVVIGMLWMIYTIFF